MIDLPELPSLSLLCTVMPDDYRYGTVHGYTGRQMRSYGEACASAALEAAANMLDTEHEHRKAADNYAKYFAHRVRALMGEQK